MAVKEMANGVISKNIESNHVMKRRKPIIDMKEMKKKSKRENINEEK
jgi:hypothetical protein